MASTESGAEEPEVKALTSLESHIFRCGIVKFTDLFQDKMFTYEYVCGRELCGEQIDIYFEIGPAVTKTPKSCTKKFENLEVNGGVKQYTKLPVILSVTPKILNGDGTVFYTCRERVINLKKQRYLTWNDEVLDVDAMKQAKTVIRENKCNFEFHCNLTLCASAGNGALQNYDDVPARQRKRSTSESSGGAKRTMEYKNTPASAVESLKKIKLDSMQVKLSTDLKNVLESQDQADVTFVVKGDKLKGHRIILSARSKALTAMLSDDNKVDGTWCVDIEDVELSVMKIILEYIYTGKIEDGWKTCADQLLVVATKWELNDLVEYLDLNIPELFTVDNSSIYLQLSKRFQLKNLEEEMTKFFMKNRDAIIKTPGFEMLREKNPAVLVDWLLAKD